MKTTLISLSLIACGARAAEQRSDKRPAKYEVEWLIGHNNIDYFEDAARHFQREVQLGSGGEIAVKIKQLDDEWEDLGKGTPGAEIVEKVARGEAQMGHSFTNVMGTMDHRLRVFDLPFLFKDYQHVEDVVEGPLGAELLKGLGRHGLEGLAFTYSGGANIMSSVRAVDGAAGLKGLRVATFGDEVDNAWLSALGAVPVTTRNSEDRVSSLVEKGAADAAVLTWRRHSRASLGRQLPHGGLEGMSYLVSVTYANKAFLDSLPAKHRELLLKAAREAGRLERLLTIDLNETSKRRLKSPKIGVQETTLTAENRRAFEKALAPVYESTLEGMLGEGGAGLVRRVRETRGTATTRIHAADKALAAAAGWKAP